MSSRRQYFLNLVWSWISAITLILSGTLVTPYLVNRLGESRYGIWTVGLSLVEYFWLIDLGMRPATVKLTAQYAALEDWDFLNSVLSSALIYSSLMGVAVMALVSLNAGYIAHFLRITNPAFPTLVHVVSISWAFGLVFNIFEASLEGFQRFDITGRIFICAAVARNVALITVVTIGYGLRAMSIALLCTQVAMYISFAIGLWRTYPKLRLSPVLASKRAAKELFSYAQQIISGVLAGRLVSAAIPSLISRLVSVRAVTYYSVTQRVLDYAGEGIGRIGVITSPQAADLTARGQRSQLVRLAEFGNKYCLMLWLLVATWLFIYGNSLFRLWISPNVAENTLYILPFLLFGYTFWLGQFISSSVLMGTGEYSEYSNSLLIEAVLMTGGFIFILPRFGLNGAAAWAGLLIFLNRSLNLARIFSNKFHISMAGFMWRSHRGPLTVALVDMLLLYAVKSYWHVLPGNTWKDLVISGVGNTILLGIAAWWFVAEEEHRDTATSALQNKKRALFRQELLSAQPPVPTRGPGGASEV